jgi:hypothetical protein
MSIKTETLAFEADPALLRDVILMQAGTLSKAVLEAVMNAADAKATRCDIRLSSTELRIADDGVGFRDRQEIMDNFRCFGRAQTPEEREGKIYGRFRMGRGQIFSFGSNTWRSGPFTMRVDIHGQGLQFDLSTNGQSVPGCEVLVRLKDDLLPSHLADLAREIERYVAYMPMVVTLNGKLASRDPAKEKWDHVTDEAYIRLKESSYSLLLYNRGAYVTEQGAYRLGLGGTVVARKPLQVNFARNEIMSGCPVWKEIKKFLDKHATRSNLRKPTLTDYQRKRLIDQYLAGELDFNEVKGQRLLTDVGGRNWSMDQMEGTRKYRVGRHLTSAPKGDRMADRVHQQKIAFVLADETLDNFNCATVADLIMLLDLSDWKAVSFSEVSRHIKGGYELMDEKSLTEKEKILLSCLDGVHRSLASALQRQNRRMVLGWSDCANGWTDGHTFIAVQREWLKDRADTVAGCMQIALLLLHEYAHDAPDTIEHTHSPEFYQLFHDASDTAAECGFALFQSFVSKQQAANKKLNRKILRQQDVLAQHAQRVVD